MTSLNEIEKSSTQQYLLSSNNKQMISYNRKFIEEMFYI
jgi:hypothetical protein